MLILVWVSVKILKAWENIWFVTKTYMQMMHQVWDMMEGKR